MNFNHTLPPAPSLNFYGYRSLNHSVNDTNSGNSTEFAAPVYNAAWLSEPPHLANQPPYTNYPSQLLWNEAQNPNYDLNSGSPTVDLTPAPSRYDPSPLGTSAVPWGATNGNITADPITPSALGDQTMPVTSDSRNNYSVPGKLMTGQEAKAYVSTILLSY